MSHFNSLQTHVYYKQQSVILFSLYTQWQNLSKIEHLLVHCIFGHEAKTDHDSAGSHD
jgi:hypothetical protein